MSKPVNLDPVLRHITKKLIEDRQALSRLLEACDPEDLKDFGEQERLLEHIQAAVRALDILEGKVKTDDTEDDDDVEEGQSSPFEAVEALLAEALRPNGAAH